MDEIVLHSGRWRAAVRPALGGALTCFDVAHGGQWMSLLRSLPVNPRDVLETSCFPMASFFGRLRGSRFVFRDREVMLNTGHEAMPCGIGLHTLHRTSKPLHRRLQPR